MVVENTGYLKLEDVLKLKDFSIFETSKKKKTLVLVDGYCHYDKISLYKVKEDRLPYKTVAGKKICSGIMVFNSRKDSLDSIDTSKWNNGNQIMSYRQFVQNL